MGVCGGGWVEGWGLRRWGGEEVRCGIEWRGGCDGGIIEVVKGKKGFDK